MGRSRRPTLPDGSAGAHGPVTADDRGTDSCGVLAVVMPAVVVLAVIMPSVTVGMVIVVDSPVTERGVHDRCRGVVEVGTQASAGDDEGMQPGHHLSPRRQPDDAATHATRRLDGSDPSS